METKVPLVPAFGSTKTRSRSKTLLLDGLEPGRVRGQFVPLHACGSWGPWNHNFYWYDVKGGRFTLIPWDLDKVFWSPEPYFWSGNAVRSNGTVPNWNVKTKDCDGHTASFDMATVKYGVRSEGSVQMREIDCDPFLKLLRPQVYDGQLAIAEAFIAGPFSEASVAAKPGAWRAQIADAIANDPLVDSAHWQTWVDNLRADLPKFHGNSRLTMSGLMPE